MVRARVRGRVASYPDRWHAFQQHMTSGEEADQYALDYVVLAYDDFGDFPADRVEPVHCELKCSLGSHFMIVKQRRRVRCGGGGLKRFWGFLSRPDGIRPPEMRPPELPNHPALARQSAADDSAAPLPATDQEVCRTILQGRRRQTIHAGHRRLRRSQIGLLLIENRLGGGFNCFHRGLGRDLRVLTRFSRGSPRRGSASGRQAASSPVVLGLP